ncbi:hypothetical protein RvY_10197 [Ramazzottius varieornatus]|uniref:Uncharacterized protein n=1 Tax=Ramazzottius varieornatus TaxID=947166 RepID=A0A1D1VL00_RAMVA|nr:hypothetical protein RvY_10197 [Ramazzottius varieornatus]
MAAVRSKSCCNNIYKWKIQHTNLNIFSACNITSLQNNETNARAPKPNFIRTKVGSSKTDVSL